MTSHVQMRALFGIPSSPGAVLGVNDLRAWKHSAQVISVHLISFVSCVARSGGSSGRSAGAGKCVSRKTWHFSSGVIAFWPSDLVMGSLGYFWVPVDHCQNWYMSIRGLSSSIFLKNCLFFHFNLCLNMLSVVWYFLSVSRGMNPHVALNCWQVSFACILSLCRMLISSSQYGTECQHNLAVGTVFFIATWCASRIAHATLSNSSVVGCAWCVILVSFPFLSSSAALKALLYSFSFAFFQFRCSLTVSPVATLSLATVYHITMWLELVHASSSTLQHETNNQPIALSFAMVRSHTEWCM